MTRVLTVVIVAALFVITIASATVAVPADGNGNKEIARIDVSDIPIFCDADDTPDLTLDVTGFIQFRDFGGEGNPNVELAVFHIDEVYTNAAGDTWVWRDRGPDRVYINDAGDPILTITGRSGANNIGHVVINLETDEILQQSGRSPFGGELFERGAVDAACDALIG